jgi:hypothetical protein
MVSFLLLPAGFSLNSLGRRPKLDWRTPKTDAESPRLQNQNIWPRQNQQTEEFCVFKGDTWHARGDIDTATCNSELERILRTASWVNESLSGYHFLEEQLNSALARTSFQILEGHSAQLQIEPKVYAAIAKMGNGCIQTICEIGFNAGHSALRWLWAAPQAQVVMFDLWEYNVAPAAEEHIRKNVEGADERLTICKGDSNHGVRRFHGENPTQRCNIISIDGGHQYEVAVQDFINMQYLVDPDFHVAFVDDTNCDADYCVDSAVERAFELGLIKTLDGWMDGAIDQEFGGEIGRGLTVFQYV